ncbi:hypothetical protein SDC9_197951 [bioreactor metagenome]|uniref:Uncharacterized protein n=1 Tax=bioreactor metagenome TaxID=1076179 RepID=A0A645IGB5_9ZZZZ
MFRVERVPILLVLPAVFRRPERVPGGAAVGTGVGAEGGEAAVIHRVKERNRLPPLRPEQPFRRGGAADDRAVKEVHINFVHTLGREGEAGVFAPQVLQQFPIPLRHCIAAAFGVAVAGVEAPFESGVADHVEVLSVETAGAEFARQ